MELHEIGVLLRREREKQGLSVEAVVEATRISRRNILAIEAGDESRLPHPVYARGFVKTYAKLLGLHSEELGCSFFQAMEPSSGSCPTSGEPPRAEQHVSRRAVSLVLVLAIVFLAIGGMTYFFLTSAREAPESTLRSGEPVVQEPAPAPASTEEPTPLTEEGPARPEPRAEHFPEPEPTGILPQAPGPERIVEQAPQKTENAIRIVADDQCWVQARVDGRRVERLLQPGQSMTLTFTSSLSVRLGNAGGVRVIYNGAPYPLNGQPGEVRVLTFP